MADTTATQLDVLLHPDRMRIAAEFSGRSGLTASQLRELLPDVPAATLYRHLTTLFNAGVLTVRGTNSKRGATEKTYGLAVTPRFSMRELARAPEQLLQVVSTVAATLIRDFTRYVRAADLRKRKVDPMLRMYAVYATDDEFAQLCEVLNRTAYEAAKKGAASRQGRRRRILYVAAIPESEEACQTTD